MGVNVASRMESNSEKGRVHLSKPAADLVKEQDVNLNLVSRGKVTIKGKGQMHTYWLLPDGVTLEGETRIKRTVSFVDEVADAVAVDMDAISVIDEASRRASEASRRASEVPGGPGGPRRGSGYVFYSEDDYTTPTGPGPPMMEQEGSSVIFRGSCTCWKATLAHPRRINDSLLLLMPDLVPDQLVWSVYLSSVCCTHTELTTD